MPSLIARVHELLLIVYTQILRLHALLWCETSDIDYLNVHKFRNIPNLAILSND